jgi:hypothetical protein
MKKNFLKISCIALIAAFAVVACKKSTDTASTPTTSAEQTTGSDDSRVQVESDAVVSESDAALSSNGSTMRTSGANPALCGVTVDATDSVGKKLVLNYNGLDCSGGRRRSGSITLQLTGGTWNTAGAVVSITFNNYSVTRVSDGKTFVFSGTKYITNVNGGLTSTLAYNSGSVVHKIQSTNMQIKFDNGTTRTWGVSRTRTITRQTATGYTISTVGDSTVVGVGNNIAIAGTSRLGTPFYSIITTPIVWNTAVCPYAPISGVRTLQGLNHSLTITYGVDQNGAATVSGCPYGVKIGWTSGTNTANSAIVRY